MPNPIRRWARRLATLGAATVLIAIIYMFFMYVTSGNLIGPVLAGNTIPWLILRLASLATVLTAALMIVSWRQHRVQVSSGTAQLSVLLAGTATFVAWASYWGLLT